MKINAQEILLVNKTRKLDETTPETIGDKTVDAPVSNPESTLKALELQGKNNLAFQGVNQSLLQKARQLPKAAVMAMAIIAGSASMTSCMEQYMRHEDHSAELITMLKDQLDKNHEETNALLLRIISLLEQNIQISKDQQGLLVKILNKLQVLDQNDKEGRAILNAILAKIEQAVADGKEIDAKTIALLETIASNQDKYGKETKDLLLTVIQKIDNLDNTVKTELTNVLGKMDELGNEQKDLLVQVLKAINMNNTLSATNNNMLSLVLRQLADLNKNDKESIALLNKIWASIEKSIKENKEMDKKTQILLQSILENIQNFNADTKDLLLKLISDLENMSAETAEAFSMLFEKIDSLDKNVQAGMIEVIAKMDQLGDDQKALLKQILSAINTSNKLSVDNNMLLSVVIRQLGQLDKNDKASFNVLNKIWVTLEKAIKENKEMDEKTHALLKSILENIQNFSEENKQNIMLLIESVKNLDSSIANAFAKLFAKMDNVGQDGQKLLNEILNQVVNSNNINAKNGEILAAILEAMGDVNVNGNNPEAMELLKNIWNTLQAHMKQDHAMDEKTHSLLGDILASIKDFNAETTVLLKEILAKSDDLGKEQLALLQVIVKNQEKLQAQGKDATNKILEAINNNTEVAKGTHVLVAEILNKMDKLGAKGDEIIDAIANISVGDNVDLSTIESMLADILAQEKANGDLLSSSDAKLSLVLVSLEGIKNAIKDGDQATCEMIQKVIDNMPESCKCDAKLEVIINKLQEIIDNTKNDESIKGDISDLEDMFS